MRESSQPCQMLLCTHRHAPGTLMERQGKGMDLFHSGMSIVMTDVEGSTGLWEWNSRIMNSALALHDHTLRSLLPKYFGYEVSDSSPFAVPLSFLPPTSLTLDEILSRSVETSQTVHRLKRKEKSAFACGTCV